MRDENEKGQVPVEFKLPCDSRNKLVEEHSRLIEEK